MSLHRPGLRRLPILALLAIIAAVGAGCDPQADAPEPVSSESPSPSPSSSPSPTPESEPEPTEEAEALDPRHDTCGEAKAAGYGPYYRGEDPEYDWYRDADSDGVVCE